MKYQTPSKKSWVYRTRSSLETKKAGGDFARRWVGATLLVGLIGDLGVGKTTFVQGMAQGLGIKEDVVSPTFTLIHEYPARPLRLVHVDLYRLPEPVSLEDLGLNDYLGPGHLVVVEWMDKVADYKEKVDLWVTFEENSKGEREIRIGHA